jgi:hypothetical protein
LRVEVSVYNVYITNQFQTTFAQGSGAGGGWGVKSVSGGDSMNSKEENSLKTVVPIIWPLYSDKQDTADAYYFTIVGQCILFSVVFTPPPATTAVFGSYLSYLYS